jgi:microcompartment protein CcmK/EutM
MKGVEEGAGELVILARGDSAVDLQVTDHALDSVVLAIGCRPHVGWRG